MTMSKRSLHFIPPGRYLHATGCEVPAVHHHTDSLSRSAACVRHAYTGGTEGDRQKERAASRIAGRSYKTTKGLEGALPRGTPKGHSKGALCRLPASALACRMHAS